MAEEKAGRLVVALVAGAVGAGCPQAEAPDAPTRIERAAAHVDVEAVFPHIDRDPRPIAQVRPHPRPLSQGEPLRQPNGPVSTETGVASLSRRLEEVLRELDSLVDESLEMQRLLLRLRIRPSTPAALPEEEEGP